MSDLMELADRVERLEGSEYAIELEIATWCYENGGIAGVNYDPRMWLERNGGGFTYSIDAAITLVPEGMLWAVANCGVQEASATIDRATATVGRDDDTSPPVEASTPALALTAAALRARLAAHG